LVDILRDELVLVYQLLQLGWLLLEFNRHLLRLLLMDLLLDLLLLLRIELFLSIILSLLPFGVLSIPLLLLAE
jgi:hypothetical protein